MTHQELAHRIAEVALLRGEFTLRSGRKSNYYLDKYRFETQPDILLALGKMLADRIPPHVDRIAGAELGAVALAAAASMASGKPCLFIRNQKKEYGTAKQIEACKTLESLGAKIDRIVGIIDRLEGARENIESAGYKFESLFTTVDLGIKT
jgi:orotate phosphoribosyltransferase